jgi:hypothetical protein
MSNSNQGVTFNGRVISNSPEKFSGRAVTPSYREVNVPYTGQELKKVFAYKASSSPKISNSGNVAFPVMDNNVAIQTSNSGGMTDIGMVTSGGRSKNGKHVGFSSPNIPSLPSDFTLLVDNNTNPNSNSNSNTTQSAGTGLDGTTDPGGDPTGPPIPVGDGWLLLVVFASIYTVWKRFKI